MALYAIIESDNMLNFKKIIQFDAKEEKNE